MGKKDVSGPGFLVAGEKLGEDGVLRIPPKIQGKGRSETGVHPCTIIKTAGWWGLSESLAGVDTQMLQVDLG